MEEFQTYSPEEIILANLEELSLRSMQGVQQELAHLRDLAEEIGSVFADNAAFLASLPDHRLSLSADPQETNSLTHSYTQSFRNVLSTCRSVLLCTELRKKIPHPEQFRQDFFPTGETENESSIKRVSYQKNESTETAFRRFSEHLGEAGAVYAHNFSSVCEDVYNGICEYCILPIENSAEGRLGSFVRLISQYDLKISATCDVKTGEDKFTRFALLRRGVMPLSESDDFTQYYEFSCALSEYPQAEDLLLAARLCGLIPEYADVRTNEHSKVRTLHAALRINQGDLPAFLLYLAMETPTANSIGRYPNFSL